MITNKKNKLYIWMIVFAAFIILAVAVGGTSSFGVFFRSYMIEFEWTRTKALGVISIFAILTGLMAMGVGKLNDKVGPRLILIVGGVLLGLGYLLISLISEKWQLYLLYGGITSIGLASTVIPTLSTIAKCFVETSCKISAFVMAGIGIGTICMPLLSDWLISNYEWRNAFITIGIISFVSIVSAALVINYSLSKIMRLRYDGTNIKKEDPNMEAGEYFLFDAIRERRFWVLVAILFCIGILISTIMGNIAIYIAELKISAAGAFNVVSLIGALFIVGSILIGAVADEIDNRSALIAGLIMMLVALLLLQTATPLFGSVERLLMPFAAVFGFYLSILIPISPIIAEFYGLDTHDILLGVTWIGLAIGVATGSILSGYIFDVTGSHKLALQLCIIPNAIAVTLGILFIKNSVPRKINHKE